MLSYQEFLSEEARTKELEHTRSLSSPLQSGTHRGYSVEAGVHAPSQANDRNKEMTKGHWDDFKGRMVAHLKTEPNGHFLIHSKKYNQGLVVQHIPEEKRIKIITALPIGNNTPKDANTIRHIIESFDFEITKGLFIS